jgi:ATP-dependent DNA ligase
MYAPTMKREIIKGVSMPFFPMRPKSGRRITSVADVKDIFARLQSGWTVQLKINGDRGEVGITADGVYIANRHGSWYGLPVDLTEFKALPPGTLLDGEVLKKRFYPFEVLAYAGRSMLHSTPAEREAKAKEVCKELSIPWIYEPTETVLSKLKANMPTIEGVVLKMAGSPYIPLATAQRESDTWIKWKWQGA